ncbi:MAG: hypothetical protein QMB94_01935, partial [Phycisphaerales bacterium]
VHLNLSRATNSGSRLPEAAVAATDEGEHAPKNQHFERNLFELSDARGYERVPKKGPSIPGVSRGSTEYVP